MVLVKVFEDAFEGAEVLLTAHTPDTGIGWTAILGNPVNTARIDDPGDGTVVQPYHSGASSINSFAINVSESQNDAQKAVFVFGEPSFNRALGVQLQDGTTDTDGYRFAWSSSNDRFQLRRLDNSSATTLGSDILDATVVSTDILEIEITASGGITTRKNGGDVHTGITDENHTGGLPGLMLNKSFTVDGPDDFEGWLEAAPPVGGFFSRTYYDQHLGGGSN